ncbi:MAG TPA: hypothetical protein VHZ26_17345 [Caulobacteraceae bacterium]|jgi:hypothetical protein|nr:hypothetical protein [Caulobacteraceae bacterium]
MKVFQLQIEDDRYSIPSLMFLEAANEGRARIRVGEILDRSPHHRSVEVYEGETLVFTLSSVLAEIEPY